MPLRRRARALGGASAQGFWDEISGILAPQRADWIVILADTDAEVDTAGCWTGARVSAQTETDLENAILTKARQLNLSNAG